METTNLKLRSDAWVSGALGAVAVTVLNESGRRWLKDAPRLDVVGERGIRKLWHWGGRSAPRQPTLFRSALTMDLVSNGAYYALVGWGSPRRPLLRGLALGAVAGLGAVWFTPAVGLGRRPVRRSARTALMTFAWYLAGGLVAGAVQRSLRRRELA